MNKHSGFSREPFRPRIEQCVTIENGVILWRGVVKSRAEMERLHKEFSGYAGGGWFTPYAADFADMIAGKLAEYDALEGNHG